jgi:iron(III) transport system substrate-binding protein
MSMKRDHLMPFSLVLLSTLCFSAMSWSQDKTLNLYSARHYNTDEALYSQFTQKTGIQINRIEMGDEALLERLRHEGRNSRADVILLVDAARLWKAQIDGLFQPVTSAVLESRIPQSLRSRNEGKGSEWFGFSSRARVIFYDKTKIRPEDVNTYEKLADSNNRGKICTRSGTHPYMLSLIGSMVERHGPRRAQEWAEAIVANFARPPVGGDIDQLRAIAAGECQVTLGNTYYWVRLLRSSEAKDRELVSKVGMIWPNQKGGGTHINVSGGGVARHSPNRQAAIQFLEYLASDEAQAYFANGNNEWPVVKSAVAKNSALDSLGKFTAEKITVQQIARNTVEAQKIVDRVGWK